LGHDPSGQLEILGPAVRYIAVAVFVFELGNFTVPAFPAVLVPFELETKIIELTDSLVAQ
jgi:hypothetical protein